MVLAGEVLAGWILPRVTDTGIKARILQWETHVLGMRQEKGVVGIAGRLVR